MALAENGGGFFQVYVFKDRSITGEYVQRCREAGYGAMFLTVDCATGIVVSNHGGRQLDHAPVTLEVLPEIVDAVGARLEVLADSGFRRSTDIIKALALGAKGVLIGKAYLYGLGAGGEAGVRRVLEILTSELKRNMTLMGLTAIDQITSDCVRWRDPRFVR